jgi:UDP-N-acetylglucosamine--N-acetylmuramyl-(pentapeptide) pyrophosphoryl-undecaprenol N-acetylglucosamine transferase
VAEDHQRHNAMALVEKGAAMMVLDADARATLMDTAETLLADPARIASMEKEILKLGKKEAARDIANEVLKLCR